MDEIELAKTKLYAKKNDDDGPDDPYEGKVGAFHQQVSPLERIDSSKNNGTATKHHKEDTRLGYPSSSSSIIGDLEYGEYNNSSCLVSARPVIDEAENGEDFHPRPSAIEYDVDSKPTRRKETGKGAVTKADNNRMFWKYILSAFLVICFTTLVCGHALTWKSWPKQNRGSSRGSSIESEEKRRMLEFVKSSIGFDPSADESSVSLPFSRAFEWISGDDPMKLSANKPNFLQRFAVAYFYFSTSAGGKDLWKYCNPLKSESAEEHDLLCHSRSTSVLGIRWLSKFEECRWAGVRCDSGGNVREIELDSMNITGSFPTEAIRLFPFLQRVSLTSSRLSGPLPPDLFQHNTHLLHFDISDNTFTGELPARWTDEDASSTLQILNLESNNLQGVIPSTIAKMSGLSRLTLGSNGFEGAIPTEIGTMCLRTFTAQRNFLTGQLPTELGSACPLYNLAMSSNNLTGSIPTPPLDAATEVLYWLDLSDNPMLSGTIPDQLWNLPLSAIELNGCNLTGTLSPMIGNLGNHMSKFTVNDNNMYGPIPTELASMLSVLELRIDGNDFTGSMPSGFCSRKMAMNEWHDVVADCLPDEVTGKVEVECEPGCCSMCCNAGGSLCLEV